jgi:dipeptidyl aminopeptidase/acylaminoacyl peptidase
MARVPRPDDLYTLRVPTDVRISPDGSRVAYVVKESNSARDEYRQSLWVAPFDGSAPARRLTNGANNDASPRWSPDGRTLAFLSDRGAVARDDEQRTDRVDSPAARGKLPDDATQVWMLPMDGGEPALLTRLPQSVSEIAWSPDGSRLCLVSAAKSAEKSRTVRKPGDPPPRDIHLIDRLQYMLNGVGYTYDKRPNLWVVEVAGGKARRITSGSSQDEQPAWSPDGKRICFVSNRHPDADLTWRTDLYLVSSDGGPVTRITAGRGDRVFAFPVWSPDGRWIASYGHRFPAAAGSRNDVWRFRPEADQVGENLSGESDLMVAAHANTDLVGFGEPRLFWSAGGDWICFSAPIDGAYELWRVGTSDCRVERLTSDEHTLSRPDALAIGGRMQVAAIRMTGHEPAEVVTYTFASMGARAPKAAAARQVSELMGEPWHGIETIVPVTRWHETDGRRIQGWFFEAPRRDGRPAPLVVEIHGGPATLYGWGIFWEWQCLLAAGISVYACNPRGSQGYGEAFCNANHRDWGDGPMRDVMDGVDALIADGLVDPDRMGVTGGSYGGYLTSWIVGHTDRFKAAVTCRSVNDMTSEMLSGDVAGPSFGRYEYGVNPWEDPELYRRNSPLTYAADIHTPLLIQHAEQDLRCTITQAEELFTVLRSLRRPVRMMRAPNESHELTRSGAPFRRVENLEHIRDWFVHYLIEGKRGLPPI